MFIISYLSVIASIRVAGSPIILQKPIFYGIASITVLSNG